MRAGALQLAEDSSSEEVLVMVLENVSSGGWKAHLLQIVVKVHLNVVQTQQDKNS